jgi:hypothetical protein
MLVSASVLRRLRTSNRQTRRAFNLANVRSNRNASGPIRVSSIGDLVRPIQDVRNEGEVLGSERKLASRQFARRHAMRLEDVAYGEIVDRETVACQRKRDARRSAEFGRQTRLLVTQSAYGHFSLRRVLPRNREEDLSCKCHERCNVRCVSQTEGAGQPGLPQGPSPAPT